MRKTLVILFIAATLSAYSLPYRLAEDLGLSNEQKDKLEKIYLDNEAKKQNLIIQLQIKQLELKKLFLKDEELERNMLKKALEDISGLRVEIRLIQYDIDKATFNILNKIKSKNTKPGDCRQIKDMEIEIMTRIKNNIIYND